MLRSGADLAIPGVTSSGTAPEGEPNLDMGGILRSGEEEARVVGLPASGGGAAALGNKKLAAAALPGVDGGFPGATSGIADGSIGITGSRGDKVGKAAAEGCFRLCDPVGLNGGENPGLGEVVIGTFGSWFGC